MNAEIIKKLEEFTEYIFEKDESKKQQNEISSKLEQQIKNL